MNLSANCLFHITPKIEYLKSILNNGFHPRYCIEEIGSFSPYVSEKEMIANPIVCFCDIPLNSIKEHILKYGYFGLGMTKDWGRKNGISPVTYVYKHSSTGDLIRFISWKAFEMEVNPSNDQFLGLVQILKSYYKTSEGQMYKDGKFQDTIYNFYNEREWRYVPFGLIEKAAEKEPNIRAFLEKEIFDNEEQREKNNGILAAYCSINFEPNDIKYLIVKAQTDLSNLADFIETSYLKDAEKKVVRNFISRIYVLDELMEDL